jgi:Mandelate racemase / muconate lactonizing enzyme, N-terminal domain
VARIASVLVCNVCVPLDRITSFATRSVKVRHYCLVKVRSSDGAEGLGYCYADNSAGNIVRSAVQDLLAPLLIREDSTRVFCGSHVEPEPVHPRGSIRRASHFSPGRQTGNYPETGSGKSALHFKPNSLSYARGGMAPLDRSELLS